MTNMTTGCMAENQAYTKMRELLTEALAKVPVV
jgi:hypothetical protein